MRVACGGGRAGAGLAVWPDGGVLGAGSGGDSRAPRGSHSAKLQALVAETEALHREVTGVSGQVLWCISQNVVTKASDRRCVANDQRDAVLALAGRMIMAGPEYMLERSDGVHLTPMAAAYLGALHGRAIARVLSGGSWQPLEMASATLSGDTVRVRFTGGDGELVTDAYDPATGPVRIGVRAVPNLGFHWSQRGGPPPDIIGCAIVGDREVRLRLSHPVDPEVSARLTLGLPPDIGLPEGFTAGDPGTAHGACANLRSAGDGSQILGLPLRDWAIHHSVPVTAARES